ncbi:hypothetical protein [Corynebacterium sp. HS2168-gen11]|uniref:hypothetical protein n=1 Tax=Corynebacterium sp. HS2168-gen11 TaxID=2974027 RepID=UPI00216B1384|nr:hypothetical protein [Corynebacterium sp. HS2168-gen11]MCS4536497.1 hypothetical protein [Corynebacterium sp. HS2168-gen11]
MRLIGGVATLMARLDPIKEIGIGRCGVEDAALNGTSRRWAASGWTAFRGAGLRAHALLPCSPNSAYVLSRRALLPRCYCPVTAHIIAASAKFYAVKIAFVAASLECVNENGYNSGWGDGMVSSG